MRNLADKRTDRQNARQSGSPRCARTLPIAQAILQTESKRRQTRCLGIRVAYSLKRSEPINGQTLLTSSAGIKIHSKHEAVGSYQ